jgi:hypothetical protein
MVDRGPASNEEPVDAEGNHPMKSLYGWLVQPGQGFTVSLQNFDTTHQATIEEAVWLGFYGYTIIT